MGHPSVGREEVSRWAPPAPTPGGRLLQVLQPQRARGRGPAALWGPSAGAHDLQVQVSSAVLRTVNQAETSGHSPPPRVHTCSQVGDSSTRPPTPCDSCPPLKDRKVSFPRGRHELRAQSLYCRKSIKCCGVKMQSQPISVSPRTMCTGRGETPREEEGAPPRPQPAPAGAPPCKHS